MNDEHKGFLVGLGVGACCVLILWIITAEMVEGEKTRAGYLIYDNKTYTVKLYDTLDVPDSNQKEPK